MSSTRELRRRIKSVKNISQITKAMQMVAATKMRKAQSQAFAGRPYSQNLRSALVALLPKVDADSNPLIQMNDQGKTGVILLTTDKALCGSLNTNVFKAVLSFMNDKKDVVFYTLGKKGRNFVTKMGKTLEADFENSDLVSFRTASQIAKNVTNLYLTGSLKEVYIIYPDFISALRQEPRVSKLLPLDIDSMIRELESAGILEDKQSRKKQDESSLSGEFLIEPNPTELLDFVLNHYLQIKVYQSILETKASEHSARMIAMQNATDNAKELVEDLQLSYNQTRQDNITRELLEITTAGAAMQ